MHERTRNTPPEVAVNRLVERRGSGDLERRDFMRQMAALLVCGGLPPGLAAGGDPGPGGASVEAVFWPTISAVQEHLWPTRADTPATDDFNAREYLAAVLLDPMVETGERRFISNGVAPLDGFAQSQFKRAFFDLETNEREALLRKIEMNPVGRYWLSLIIYYLFEALLSDPAYGGNSDAIGWRWLEHQSGFPRPPTPYPYTDNERA